jgi:hypothetical protein
MSLSPKIDEIRPYVQDNDPDIMCFTETWLKDTVESSVIHAYYELYPCQEGQDLCTTWGSMPVY